MKRYVKLYENYPGADPIPVTIEKCMETAESLLGIPRYLSKIAIRAVLSYYAGAPKTHLAKKGAPLLMAIDYWQGCYISMMEDGYGTRQIEEELEKAVSRRG